MTHTIHNLVLARARDLVADRRTWTRYAAARNSRGERCWPYQNGAVRFCAFGALWRAAYELTGDRKRALHLASVAENFLLGPARPGRSRRLCTINDRRGRHAVLDLLSGRQARA